MLITLNNINNQDEYGYTGLIYAIQANRRDIVNILIDNGADINFQNKDGKTPIMEAAIYGQSDMINLLGRITSYY